MMMMMMQYKCKTTYCYPQLSDQLIVEVIDFFK